MSYVNFIINLKHEYVNEISFKNKGFCNGEDE